MTSSFGGGGYFVSLVKFSDWSKFHVNVITGSGIIGIMTIFFYKRLTRNLGIGNTPAWVLPNICRLWLVRETKSGTNVSSKMLLNAVKCQGYSFYRFWVIKGKPTGGGEGGGGERVTPSPSRLGLTCTSCPSSVFIAGFWHPL